MTRFAYQFIAGCLFCGAMALAPCSAATATADQSAALEPQASATGSDNRPDPEAMAELKRATDFLAAMPRLHLKAEVAYDVMQEDGRRLQFEKNGDIYLQRPDRFFAEIFLDDGRHRQLWYDGKTLSIAETSRRQHTRTKAPPTIDETLDLLENLFQDPMPLADLLYGDLTPLSQRALEADVVGDSRVHGRSCRQLAFRGETVDWQIWIEKGAKPFIRKLAISYREVPGEPQFVAWIDTWEMPKKFKEGRFIFAAPAGSKQIELPAPVSRPVENGGKP